eukprot:9347736-Heterocapsa_arctica.AAC.1
MSAARCSKLCQALHWLHARLGGYGCYGMSALSVTRSGRSHEEKTHHRIDGSEFAGTWQTKWDAVGKGATTDY